jgi:hypothetical protein
MAKLGEGGVGMRGSADLGPLHSTLQTRDQPAFFYVDTRQSRPTFATSAIIIVLPTIKIIKLIVEIQVLD